MSTQDLTGPRAASRAMFDDAPPQRTSAAGTRTWIIRGGNFVVTYIDGKAGDSITIDDVDEFFVYVVDGEAELTVAGAQAAVGTRTVSILPAGSGIVRFIVDTRIVRLSSCLSVELAGDAANAAAYAGRSDDFASISPMADLGGQRPLRTYRLDDYANRPMRLFRCENVMVNVFDHAQPRSTGALTPHSHDDFEQGSFAVAGDWMHHLRRPWTPDLSEWREDEHLSIGSPSLVVIPTRMIHTSRSVSPGYAQLLDVFAPPRVDFLAQGLVCNADEYADAGTGSVTT